MGGAIIDPIMTDCDEFAHVFNGVQRHEPGIGILNFYFYNNYSSGSGVYFSLDGYGIPENLDLLVSIDGSGSARTSFKLWTGGVNPYYITDNPIDIGDYQYVSDIEFSIRTDIMGAESTILEFKYGDTDWIPNYEESYKVLSVCYVPFSSTYRIMKMGAIDCGSVYEYVNSLYKFDFRYLANGTGLYFYGEGN